MQCSALISTPLGVLFSFCCDSVLPSPHLQNAIAFWLGDVCECCQWQMKRAIRSGSRPRKQAKTFAKFDWLTTTGLPWVAHFCRSRCPRKGVLETKYEFWGSRVVSIRRAEIARLWAFPFLRSIYYFKKEVQATRLHLFLIKALWFLKRFALLLLPPWFLGMKKQVLLLQV